MTKRHTNITSVLLSAVAGEVNLLRQALTDPCPLRCGHVELTVGNINGQRVAIGCCGIGKAAAAAAATAIFNNVTAGRLIMLGCAGAYLPSGLQVGDLAVATQEILADEGVETATNFLDLEQLNFPLARTAEGQELYHRFPCDRVWLANAKSHLPRYAAQHNINCLFGAFATVSSCSGTAIAGERLYHRTHAIIENMEGAAAALVCAQYQIPFAQIRAISNMVEERDMSRWQLSAAMRRAQQSVLFILQQESDN